MAANPKDILHRYWGFASFRPRQAEIIESVLRGNDTLALLPTGGGKSICYQVPALCREGLCVVVSPLIALMHDQVENLKKRGIAAVYVNSFMSQRQIDIALDNCVYGQIRFLYISPERLKNDMFRMRLARMKVNLLAVDEAHCISQWGYDFRPAYLDIATVREVHPHVPVLALTATATPKVADDIQDKLKFRKRHSISSSFARPNLSYLVYREEDKQSRMIHIVHRLKGSGIVYCGTRGRTYEVAQLLIRSGINATWYHAGLSRQERQRAQEQWFSGERRVICATNAFGMGIDKPDVRFVLHADLPASPEAYFQEAGRAGRDGQKAYAVLLYHRADLESLRQRIALQFPPMEQVRRFYNALCSSLQIAIGAGQGQWFPLDLKALTESYQLETIKSLYALRLLEKAGYLQYTESLEEPSKIFFLMSREPLYRFQVAHPALDEWIKLLLRSYGGMFEDFVAIDEGELARHARTTVELVQKNLHALARAKVIDYIPRTQEPQVCLLVPRLHSDRINIPDEFYKDRQKREMARAEAVIDFMQTDKCRVRQLLEYFGEQTGQECGSCDVCRKAKSSRQPDDYEAMNAAIRQALISSPCTLEELPGRLPQFDRTRLIKLAQWKIDAGEISVDKLMNLKI